MIRESPCASCGEGGRTVSPHRVREAASAGRFDGVAWWGGPHRLRGVEVASGGRVAAIDASIANAMTQLLFVVAEDRCPRRDLHPRRWAPFCACELAALVRRQSFAYGDWPPELGFPRRMDEAIPEFMEAVCAPPLELHGRG